MPVKKIVLFYPKPDKDNSNMHLPLPILVIASELLRNGLETEIIDERKEPDYKARLAEQIEDIAIFGVSVMTGYQIKGGLEASRFVKKLNKKAKVVWGGWHVSMLPQETLNSPFIDIGVIGPGEHILKQLHERIAGNEGFSGIPNLIFKDNGKVIVSQQKEDIAIIYSISKESMELIDAADYIGPSELGRDSIFWVTSAGCPFSCGFCCSSKVFNRRWNGLEAGKVIQDLEWLVERYGINGVNFVDTNFFVDKKRVSLIARGIIEKKLNIHWVASIRVDQVNLLDDEFLTLIKESGCIKLFVGAESGSREVLDLIDKNINLDDIRKMAKRLAQAGIVAEIFVMAGFPLDPEKELNETIGLAKEIKKLYPNHQFTSFIYTPYPGTPLFSLALKRGLKTPLNLEGWIKWNILEVRTPWIKQRKYADRFHSFIKMYYPLAFPSDNLKIIFQDKKKGWFYKFLHKLEYFRVKHDFFLFPLEWYLMKTAYFLKNRHKILNNFSGFR